MRRSIYRVTISIHINECVEFWPAQGMVYATRYEAERAANIMFFGDYPIVRHHASHRWLFRKISTDNKGGRVLVRIQRIPVLE